MKAKNNNIPRMIGQTQYHLSYLCQIPEDEPEQKLREREPTLSEIIGFGIKYQETGGTQLRNSFNFELGKIQKEERSNTQAFKKGQENINKLQEEKTDDLKLARRDFIVAETVKHQEPLMTRNKIS